jgi:uncharacterized membrane protein YkgB
MGVLKLFELASRMDKVGVTVTRVGLIIVLLWIGGLKAFRYEADGIVPLVANSPTMSFFYADAGNYKAHKNPEGALVPENRSWHEANRTYIQGKRITVANVIIRPRLDLDKCTSEESLPDTSWFTEEIEHGSFQSRFAA